MISQEKEEKRRKKKKKRIFTKGVAQLLSAAWERKVTEGEIRHKWKVNDLNLDIRKNLISSGTETFLLQAFTQNLLGILYKMSMIFKCNSELALERRQGIWNTTAIYSFKLLMMTSNTFKRLPSIKDWGNLYKPQSNIMMISIFLWKKK